MPRQPSIPNQPMFYSQQQPVQQQQQQPIVNVQELQDRLKEAEINNFIFSLADPKKFNVELLNSLEGIKDSIDNLAEKFSQLSNLTPRI